MNRNIHFMGRLPSFYQGVEEFEAIGQTLDEEFRLLAQANEEDLHNYFVMTADAESIGIWEREIGIRASAGETLDFRRKRLINRYTMKPPFTIGWLDRQLRDFLGAGFLRTERDDDVEILTVYADIDSLSALLELDTLIETVLPLSMQYYRELSGHKELSSKLYVGSAHPMYLRIEIQPA